jgi:hypothetical protein
MLALAGHIESARMRRLGQQQGDIGNRCTQSMEQPAVPGERETGGQKRGENTETGPDFPGSNARHEQGQKGEQKIGQPSRCDPDQHDPQPLQAERQAGRTKKITKIKPQRYHNSSQFSGARSTTIV